MKHLRLFLFLSALLPFCHSALVGQTSDYTLTDQDGGEYNTNGRAPRTYTFALGPDTLDASSDPDTLIIDFDQSFYGLMNVYATVKTDSLVVGGTVILVGKFEFQQAQCASCKWERINNSNDDLPVSFSNPMTTDVNSILQDVRIRLLYIAESGKSAIRTWLTLKPL